MSRAVFGVAVVSLLGLAAPAAAAPSRDLAASHFDVAVGLGLAGGLHTTRNDQAFVVGESAASRDSVQTSLQVAGQYNHGVHRFLAVGAGLALSAWRSERAGAAGLSHNLSFDLALAARGRLPLSAASELYITLPLGPSLERWNESPTYGSDVGVGYHVSLVVGARYAVSAGVSMFVEAGYLFRSVVHVFERIGITQFADGDSGSSSRTLVGPSVLARTSQLVARLGISL